MPTYKIKYAYVPKGGEGKKQDPLKKGNRVEKVATVRAPTEQAAKAMVQKKLNAGELQ